MTRRPGAVYSTNRGFAFTISRGYATGRMRCLSSGPHSAPKDGMGALDGLVETDSLVMSDWAG